MAASKSLCYQHDKGIAERGHCVIELLWCKIKVCTCIAGCVLDKLI